ncbi:MAG TPA: PIN domain-containing protein [Candidatus Acidoferrum sp.]|nr:PIN domain-containing protein [Candidatus Acidoferrum sp.]
MTPSYGIDTSVLVRLVTGDPAAGFQRTVAKLSHLVEQQGASIYASNQVIGETYIALQHHYGIDKADARAGLLDVLRSGLVSAMNGASALAALQAKTGCGLLDRLIHDDYSQHDFTTLTLDRKMGRLPGAASL